ncbi:glycosyltransferase BC10-like [Physcomitrium patens]|uniref:Uncharacterized protein n=2 Tax=Physcomitrium patens TaxID=3218 RepID=A0A2K1IFS4_PHYPA|nr:hypothetical protein PHYPA_028723 [Physcomitrium patens]
MPGEAMIQDRESTSSSKRDSQRVRLWRGLIHSDYCPSKKTHMYALLASILFVGSVCFVVMSSLGPNYMNSRIQGLSVSPTGDIPSYSKTSKRDVSGNANAAGGMDISAQIQKAVIIDVNASAPPGQLLLKDPVCYQNMSVTWHQLSDEQLRQKASEAPLQSRGSKIAFMFITKGPMPFASMWERYFCGHENQYSIFLHAHPDYVPSLNPASPFFGRFIPSQEAEWGKVSLQEAENRLLFNAILDETNSWFVLLSESCIPVENFPNSYRHITESQQNFIMAFQESTILHKTRLYRGKHKQMAPEVVVDNFRKGSQWFQINRDLALLVPNDTMFYNKFVNYFCQPHPVCYIDEHYLPTLFFSSRSETLAFRTLTYFEFPHHGPHPTKWDKTNTNAGLIKWIREGHSCSYNGLPTNRCYMFARKFDLNALPNLLELAHDIMGIP